ncbi:MAG: hypothetical protein L0Y71_03250 [Gemmataceae bacterium]|nr:hypothetical protein [Gemmataceae bacterium]
MPDTPLPEDWEDLLNRFAESLEGVQQSLAKAAALPANAAPSERASAYPALLQEHADRHAGLANKATDITRWVDAIESELRISEDLLRVLLTQTETVRQKLAAWTGRAIG